MPATDEEPPSPLAEVPVERPILKETTSQISLRFLHIAHCPVLLWSSGVDHSLVHLALLLESLVSIVRSSKGIGSLAVERLYQAVSEIVPCSTCNLSSLSVMEKNVEEARIEEEGTSYAAGEF